MNTISAEERLELGRQYDMKKYMNYGGGISLSSQPADSVQIFLNNTFSKNSSDANGGAIYCTNTNPVIINNILWQDTAAIGSEIYVESGTPNIMYSDIKGG